MYRFWTPRIKENSEQFIEIEITIHELFSIQLKCDIAFITRITGQKILAWFIDRKRDANLRQKL